MVDIGYSVNTVNLTLSALKGVAKSAFNLGQMSADNMMRIDSVKSLKGSAVRIGRKITTLEISTLLNSVEIDVSARSSRDKAILSIGLGAGLRCSEICSLDINVKDINQPYASILSLGTLQTYRDLFRCHLDTNTLSAIRSAVAKNLALGNERFKLQIEDNHKQRVTALKAGRKQSEVLR